MTQPGIEVDLERSDTLVEGFAHLDAEELVQYGAVEALDRHLTSTRNGTTSVLFPVLVTVASYSRAPWKGATTQRVRNPPGELSLQPVAIGAVHGGNKMD